jgi:hypothetical protein
MKVATGAWSEELAKPHALSFIKLSRRCLATRLGAAYKTERLFCQVHQHSSWMDEPWTSLSEAHPGWKLSAPR